MIKLDRLPQEFADFDVATLPAIPADWEDHSWHNDTCPSFGTPNGYYVFVDYADPSLREISECERFSVHFEGTCLGGSDDWDAIVGMVADMEACLSAEFVAYCKATGLPNDASADDLLLLHGVGTVLLSETQQRWVRDFVERWEAMREQQDACVRYTLPFRDLQRELTPDRALERLHALSKALAEDVDAGCEESVELAAVAEALIRGRHLTLRKPIVDVLRDLREECRDWEEAVGDERPSLRGKCLMADAVLQQESAR